MGRNIFPHNCQKKNRKKTGFSEINNIFYLKKWPHSDKVITFSGSVSKRKVIWSKQFSWFCWLLQLFNIQTFYMEKRLHIIFCTANSTDLIDPNFESSYKDPILRWSHFRKFLLPSKLVTIIFKCFNFSLTIYNYINVAYNRRLWRNTSMHIYPCALSLTLKNVFSDVLHYWY